MAGTEKYEAAKSSWMKLCAEVVERISSGKFSFGYILRESQGLMRLKPRREAAIYTD